MESLHQVFDTNVYGIGLKNPYFCSARCLSYCIVCWYLVIAMFYKEDKFSDPGIRIRPLKIGGGLEVWFWIYLRALCCNGGEDAELRIIM
uniref:Uncharacterized protein n=1 Tax=Arundo donax TaxID=35708 RepID=A0A0A9CQT3_ARUDO